MTKLNQKEMTGLQGGMAVAGFTAGVADKKQE